MKIKFIHEHITNIYPRDDDSDYVNKEETIKIEILKDVDLNDKLRDVFFDIYLKNSKKYGSPWSDVSESIMKEQNNYHYSLLNDGVCVNSSIKYELNKDGTISLLKGYNNPLRQDPTISDLLELKKIGVINGDFNCIEFRLVYGLGAGGNSNDILVELAKYIWSLIDNASTIGGAAGLFVLIKDSYYKNKQKKNENISYDLCARKRVDKLLEKLIANNKIYNIIELRELFDDVGNWTTEKCKELLCLNEEEAHDLLTLLGYKLSGNNWSLSQDIKSTELRLSWLKMEEKYKKDLLEEYKKLERELND